MTDLSQQLEKLKQEILSEVFDQIEAFLADIPNKIAKLDTNGFKDLLMGSEGIQGPSGPKGDMGISPIPGVHFPLPKDGQSGKDGRDGKDGKNINEEAVFNRLLNKIPKFKQFKLDTAQQIRDKLQSLQGEEKLSASAIKNLPKPSTLRIGGGGGNTVLKANLSSQVDGSATTFTIADRTADVLLLISTQGPILYLPTTDFTIAITASNQTTITMNGSLPAFQSGQSLQALYVQG